VVELGRTHAEIEEHAGQRLCGDFGKRSEGGVDQSDPIAEPGEALAGGREGNGIAIEPNDAQAGVGVEQCLTMSPTTHRRIDDDAGRYRSKERNDFITQDGNVFERLDHLQPPDWLEERRE